MKERKQWRSSRVSPSVTSAVVSAVVSHVPVGIGASPPPPRFASHSQRVMLVVGPRLRSQPGSCDTTMQEQQAAQL